MKADDYSITTSPDISIREIYIGEDSNISLPQNELSNTIENETRKNKKSESLKNVRLNNRIVPTPEILVDDIFEYRWPPDDAEGHVPFRSSDKDSADWFVIQEVVSSLLQIKSFKRKYPDLFRRLVDGWEKDWLLKKNMVPRPIADLGLTALRSDEVLSLLEKDYPEMHAQVFRVFQERKLQWLAEQQKEQYQISRVEKGSKLDVLRKKALQSAVEYNRSLIQDRKRERLFYWDLQTMQIHVPQNKRPLFNAINDSGREAPPVKRDSGTNNEYPIAVIPGQFSSRYKNYNTYEIGYVPINTTMYSGPHPEKVKQFSLQIQNSDLPTLVSKADLANQPLTPKPMNSPTANNGITCSVCRQRTENPLKCADRGKGGHPACMDIKDDMIDIVRSYNWSCMDCKKCHKCSQATDEEQMMFCDKCDRGYHAYCVGLKGIPDGNWECSNCVK